MFIEKYIKWNRRNILGVADIYLFLALINTYKIFNDRQLSAAFFYQKLLSYDWAIWALIIIYVNVVSVKILTK